MAKEELTFSMETPFTMTRWSPNLGEQAGSRGSVLPRAPFSPGLPEHLPSGQAPPGLQGLALILWCPQGH